MSASSSRASDAALFSPARLGDIAIANRVVMAPLTRNRAGAGGVPTELMATYYAQRAGAGLIVSEGTQIRPDGQGYLDTPGIYTPEQVAGWRRVTDAVHARGGRIVCQLWHVGRISHFSVLPFGTFPVSSTARRAQGKTFTASGFQPVSTPRALRTDEIPGLVDAYAHAARCAIEAGFDGVEVHGANGYLIEQFLRDSINDRTDAYGGTIENRVRFLQEVMTAVAAAIGAGRTGLRLSPLTPSNEAGLDSDPQRLYGHAVDVLAPLGLAFIHVVEGVTGGPRDNAPFDFEDLRRRFQRGQPGSGWIVNNGYTRPMALDAVASGRATAVAFGRPFIANPDLVDRLLEDAPLAEPQRETFYGGGAPGYTDYPQRDGSLG
ncbi:MAG: alkene reductase [Rhodobacteraceae bacterium]|nr:alkene reductase [Paracoccaceae bacterium]